MRIFEDNIRKALKWLFDIQDEDNYGWSWTRDISPNAQNTAEVVCSCLKFTDFLDENQKYLLCEATKNWLLEPSLNGVLVVDYVWIMYALVQVAKNYELLKPDYPKERILIASQEAVDLILEQQNDDGGWADEKGDYSTTVRTGVVLYCLAAYIDLAKSTEKINIAINAAVNWLIRSQNSDGGWGNKKSEEVIKELKKIGKLDDKTISAQYLSNAVSTGYALMGLEKNALHEHNRIIAKGIYFLEKEQNTNGSFYIFYEVGMRKNVQFTFRHFGTVWALKGLMGQSNFSIKNQSITKAIYYLLQLQDEASGAWKCSPESDVYTWSTANALSILSTLYSISNFELRFKNTIEELLIDNIVTNDKQKVKKIGFDKKRLYNSIFVFLQFSFAFLLTFFNLKLCGLYILFIMIQIILFIWRK